MKSSGIRIILRMSSNVIKVNEKISVYDKEKKKKYTCQVLKIRKSRSVDL